MKEKRLVLAVTNQAPLDKIQEILDHHPLAIKSINKFTKKTPLHWACQFDTSIEVLRVLVEQHPEAVAHPDNQGNTPLHVACSKSQTTDVEVIDCLLKACPRAAQGANQEEETPLHNACHHKASLPVLHALIQTYPQAVLMQTRTGKTPLDVALDTSSNVDFLDPAERPVIRQLLETTMEHQRQVQQEQEEVRLQKEQTERERQQKEAEAKAALELALRQQAQLKSKLHAQRKDQEARTAEIISKKREAERQKEELRRQLRAEMERQQVAAAAAKKEEEDKENQEKEATEGDGSEEAACVAEKVSSPREQNPDQGKSGKEEKIADGDESSSSSKETESSTREEDGEEKETEDKEPRSSQSSPTSRLTATEPRQQPEGTPPRQAPPPGLSTTPTEQKSSSIAISPNAAEAVLSGIWGVPLLQDTYSLLDQQPIHHLELERELVERSQLKEVDTFFQGLLSKPSFSNNPHTASISVEGIAIGQAEGSKMAVKPPPGYEKADGNDDEETLGILEEQILQHRNELDHLWKQRSDVAQSDGSTSTSSPTPLSFERNLEPEGMVVPPATGDALPGLLLSLPEHQQLINEQESVWRRMGMTNTACETPLHLACTREKPCVSTIQALIESFPASVRNQNREGRTPLHLACTSTSASVEVIRILLDACPDAANMTDLSGNTPLHVAAASGCPFDVVQLLLATFADSKGDDEGAQP